MAEPGNNLTRRRAQMPRLHSMFPFGLQHTYGGRMRERARRKADNLKRRQLQKTKEGHYSGDIPAHKRSFRFSTAARVSVTHSRPARFKNIGNDVVAGTELLLANAHRGSIFS